MEAIQIAIQVARVCNHQLQANRWFSLENPQRSDLWRIPEIATLIQKASACVDSRATRANFTRNPQTFEQTYQWQRNT
eukprot:5051067-Amphidinium_carterae.1